ncbi:MAG TPA: sigma-70 family RNA polymerase sigma factor [Bryobacteraceae bacterium]|nr:sigma-70 family RNA polymerase sigma factor [Bryobacteraceae bacterium]
MSDLPITLADSFEQVFREREADVLRTAYRILGNWADAEDVAQETFIRLHKHGLRFPNDIALKCWLYRVAVNLCLDRTRSRRRFEEVPETIACSTSVEADAIRDEQRQTLMAALATLPPKERAAVVLREIEELSTAEVAEILGSTDGTIRSQVAKAIAKLRSTLLGARQ